MVLAMLAGATQALAGPVLTLAADGTFGNTSVSEGKFAEAFSQIHLDSEQVITGYLSTQASQAIDIESVFLVKLDAAGAPIESSRRSFNEVLAVNWDDEDYGAERWELPSALLSAGNWQIQVSGEGLGGKHGAAYSGAIVQTANAVPEPQTLALSVLALAAMAGLARRRKSA